MPDRLLDADAIVQYVTEVAEEVIDDGNRRALVIVGGALLAWHHLRSATRDVDSVVRLDEVLIDAVERVASRHDLAPRWLNDAASAFLPTTFDIDSCSVLLDHPALLVLGAPIDQVFLMKLFASRAADTDDLEVLWPLSTFVSTEAAVDAFYEAYPHEKHDPHLAEHLRGLG